MTTYFAEGTRVRSKAMPDFVGTVEDVQPATGIHAVTMDTGETEFLHTSELEPLDSEDPISSLAAIHPTLHIGSVAQDHLAHTVTLTFDAFIGDDDIPTAVTKRTFSGLAATRILMETFAGMNGLFGLTPEFS